MFGIYPSEVDITVSNGTIVSTRHVIGLYNPGMYATVSVRARTDYNNSLTICERHAELIGRKTTWSCGRYTLRHTTVEKLLCEPETLLD